MNDQSLSPSPTEIATAAARLVAAFGPIDWVDPAVYASPRRISTNPAPFPLSSQKRAA